MSNPSPAPRKSVSCSNPWCSDRALCVHCKADHAPKGEADFTLKASDTQRGFHRIDFKDRYGNACSLQDSSLATEACVWFGDNRERAHLTAPMVAALLPHLAAFVECGSIRNPTAENEQHPVSASDTAAADGVTMAQCPDCAAVHDARRVVQSDPPAPGAATLLAEAASLFRKYEAHHRAKGTAESMLKANVNASIADRIEAFIQTAPNLSAMMEAAARADAFDDAAAIVAIQHRHGGLNLTTEQECETASWAFRNQAYMTRRMAGLPHPDDAIFHAETQKRLLDTFMPKGASVTFYGHVKMPTSEAEAKAMVLLGEAFLKGRAEEAARS